MAAGATSPAGAAAALPLRTGGPATAPRACWAELKAHEIELAPPLVHVYFREIRPPEAVLARQSAQREAGQPWRERYRKFARVERTQGDESPAVLLALRRPLGLPLEIVPEGDAPLRAGQAASFRVLSEGRPVAGLAIELVSGRNPLGVWTRSDDEGRIRHILPFRGDWLLRATLLDLPGSDGLWHSRFVTLAFDAA